MNIFVLFDGTCHLCQNSVVALRSLDWLHKLHFVDFRNDIEHKKYAPEITMEELDRAMHIKYGDRTEKGFDAFRVLCWHLPLLMVLVPFLYIPGVPVIGRKIYTKIADSRNRCSDGVCKHR